MTTGKSSAADDGGPTRPFLVPSALVAYAGRMRFKGLDLNLLVVLDALITSRSVSRAAEKLNLSQPAISSSLKRLRTYFGDEILVLKGKRMFPTAYAEALLPQLRESLRAVEGLITTSALFEPATSQRTFRLCGSDYMTAAFFAPLSRRLAIEAPGVRLEIVSNDERSWTQLDQGLIDLIVTPEDYIRRDLPAEHLLDEHHVVLGWDQNGLFPDRVTRAAFLKAGHVQVAIGPARTVAFGDHHIQMAGVERRIEAVAPTFTVIPWLLVGTQRMAMMQERLARIMAQHYAVAIAKSPFAVPPMREMIQFHPTRRTDPGLQWLRDSLHAQVRDV